MKMLKPGNTQRCSFCEQMAKWMSSSLSFKKYSCDLHKEDLTKHEIAAADDGHMSEADYQTWGRL